MANSSKYTKIIIFPPQSRESGGAGLINRALSDDALAKLILSLFSGNNAGKVIFAVPQGLAITTEQYNGNLIRYNSSLEIPAGRRIVLCDGRFFVRADANQLSNAVDGTAAEVTAVTISPNTTACREKIKLTTDGYVAGFSRVSPDVVLPESVLPEKPHLLFIRSETARELASNGDWPTDFSSMLSRFRAKGVSIAGIRVPGEVFDLDTADGLFDICAEGLKYVSKKRLQQIGLNICLPGRLSDSAKFFGKVLSGHNVILGESATVAGPSVICNDAKIGESAVIRNSIVGEGVSIPAGAIIENRILLSGGHDYEIGGSFSPETVFDRSFRFWPGFSYAGFFKRFFDVIFSTIILILFAPVFPVIMLAVKLGSRGPVFYKDKRQGLHGQEFHCIKFRSMITGAAGMQELLRSVNENEADGPQFKMDRDPRVSAVGVFLRDTYLDELPQFINVLLGQMSVVGPRPSPVKENSCCPGWRDARLSVRPGITGLWQVCRTRLPSRDFQEWLYYDTQYVKKLSFSLDLWICWKTVLKFVHTFVRRF